MANKKNNGKTAARFIKHRHGVRAKLHETQQALKYTREKLDSALRELQSVTAERDSIRPTLEEAIRDLVTLRQAAEVLARRGL